jgi:hypothetical protein
MGAFTGVASDLGRAAKLSIEMDFYALLALNAGLGPTMSDGVTLFHANHKNITTGAALSAANLDLDRVAMASQTDVSGNEILDLKPNILLDPVSLGGQARVINDSAYDPTPLANKSQMKPNIAGKMFDDIVDTARLTGTAVTVRRPGRRADVRSRLPRRQPTAAAGDSDGVRHGRREVEGASTTSSARSTSAARSRTPASKRRP